MRKEPLLRASERWVRLLLHLYPRPFREDVGSEVIEAYRDRCRAILRRHGTVALLCSWLWAALDCVRNALGEWIHPSAVTRDRSETARPTWASRRDRERGILGVGLSVSVALHAILFMGVPSFVVQPAQIRAVRLQPASEVGPPSRLVDVSFSVPEIVGSDGSLRRAPVGWRPEARRVDAERLSRTGCTWSDRAHDSLSGRIHVRLLPSGGKGPIELASSTGEPCADELIRTLALTLRYEGSFRAELSAPVEILQTIRLDRARYR